MGEKTNEKYIYHDKNGTFKAAPWMRCPRTNKRIKREKGGIPTMAEAIAWRDQKILEVEGVPESIAREALSAAAAKMPVRCRFATRD